jgi:hypothetical protein
MGSPDVLQIDGLGGSRPITSKVAIAAASARPDADVDYTFAQVEIDRPGVGHALAGPGKLPGSAPGQQHGGLAAGQQLWLAHTRPDRRRSGTGPIREPLPQRRYVGRAKPEGGKHPVAPLVESLARVREVLVG